MYWKICIVGIFQVYKINFFFFKKDLYQRFWIESADIGPFKLYWFKTYTSVFESVGIGTTYASAFKSAGIGYIHIFIKAVPALLKTPEQGLKAPGPIPALLKSAGTGPHDPIPTFKKRRSEAPGKKTSG